MKNLVSVLVIVAFVAMGMAPALAGGKKAKEVEEVVEKTITDYLTPMETLVGEYHRIVAQIKQKENEIKVLELQLEKIDAVVQYQRGIEKKIEADKKETNNPID